MNTYDYRNSSANIDKLSVIVDRVTEKEAEQALAAIEETRQKESAEKIENFLTWFDTAILPILKDFSETTASILEIDAICESHITASIRNESGIDITAECKLMKIVMAFAVHIAVEMIEDTVALTLTYDCN